jgi:osmoprotectant transport system permease protein
VNEPFVRWDWVDRHAGDIRALGVQHIKLTFVAVGIGLVIALVCSLIAIRYRATYAPIAAVMGVLYSIPSLALFAILVPITGLGFVTAEVGLVSYTLLILLRNIVSGVDGVPAPIKEAADGMGYRPMRRFFAVDLRLASPVIIAGIRIATVTTIGLVTITAIVGEGGFGSLISEGIGRSFPTPIVVGTVLSVLLAVAFDIAFVALEWVMTPWARKAVAR